MNVTGREWMEGILIGILLVGGYFAILQAMGRRIRDRNRIPALALVLLFLFLCLAGVLYIVMQASGGVGQMLFVMGDFQNDTRTHHIHVVKWREMEWNHYISFRDYLNTYPEKAMIYDECKKKLAAQFPYDRKSYTEGKQGLIECLLREADRWKSGAPIS